MPSRDHHVTAILVAHDGARWLPATLTTVAGLTRRPDVLVGVDTASTDGSADLLRESFGDDRVTTAARDAGFGAAVAAGIAHADARVEAGLAPAVPPGSLSWVWLLHDDSAPAPDALEQLLRTSDTAPSAAVLGPKVRGWHDMRLLLECGLTVSGSGRRTTGLERGEHDQGQHDAVRDVLAVGSAGMLVRRDVWDALGGFDPRLPMFRDDLDLGWRANEAGHRVLVAPAAVVHHAEAGAGGRRPLAAVSGTPHRADRAAATYSSLVHAGGWRVVPQTLRVAIGTLLRALGLLLAKVPREAADELAALIAVLAHPGRVREGRALVAATRVRTPREVAHLRPPPGASIRHALRGGGWRARHRWRTRGGAQRAGDRSGRRGRRGHGRRRRPLVAPAAPPRGPAHARAA